MADHLLITAKQFQQKCVAVLRPELRKQKSEHFSDSEKTEMLEVTGCQPIATPICRKCGDI
ncbi:hypothetical protein U8P68_15520 [Rhizobium ruizarguesonis]|nr:hypothetical protein U8P68_15520 [Rhizobium ruizarguesonis]